MHLVQDHGHHGHDHDDHDHSHHPSRDHPHDHGPGAAGPLERITHVHGGPTVLDIGGEIGALVVLVGDDRLGTELFVRAPDGREAHTGVWRRRLGLHPVAAAVFCELTQGTYALLAPSGQGHQAVTIIGGDVLTLDLRGQHRGP
jgi:hypothetical protein